MQQQHIPMAEAYYAPVAPGTLPAEVPAFPVAHQPQPQPQPQYPPQNGGAPPPAASSTPFNETALRQYLSHHLWPLGLQNVLIASLAQTPVRFFIVDDSGSMNLDDGQRVIRGPHGARLVKCSRWHELTEAMKFHCQLAHVASAPTEFRLLNGAPPLKIGASAFDDATNIGRLNAVFDGSGPDGQTPLCRHVAEVCQQLQHLAPLLSAGGKKAAVVIATDGEASDGDISIAMRPLHLLPCQVTIRLCTNDENVTGYWETVDKNLELRLDIIDDLVGEAKEVAQYNSWLTYGEPLQRVREFGVLVKEFDLIDEKKLSADNVRNFLATLYGVPLNDLPHPEADWPSFLRTLTALNDREPPVWNPVSHTLTKWVDLPKLVAAYGPNRGFSAHVRQGPGTGTGGAGAGPGSGPIGGGGNNRGAGGCCGVM